MAYWERFYHLVWATKYRAPLLTPEIEPIIHELLRGKAIGLGAHVFAVNGVEDHVHMAAAVPPRIGVARFVGQVKAVASTRFNKSGHPAAAFFWQDEYAVFSFDRKRLPNYISYVERQKQHHARGTTIPILERTEGEDITLMAHSVEVYAAEDASWRAEMEALSNTVLAQ